MGHVNEVALEFIRQDCGGTSEKKWLGTSGVAHLTGMKAQVGHPVSSVLVRVSLCVAQW